MLIWRVSRECLILVNKFKNRAVTISLTQFQLLSSFQLVLFFSNLPQSLPLSFFANSTKLSRQTFEMFFQKVFQMSIICFYSKILKIFSAWFLAISSNISRIPSQPLPNSSWNFSFFDGYAARKYCLSSDGVLVSQTWIC